MTKIIIKTNVDTLHYVVVINSNITKISKKNSLQSIISYYELIKDTEDVILID